MTMWHKQLLKSWGKTWGRHLSAGLMLGTAMLPAWAEETIDVLVLYTDEMLTETADADTRIATMAEWMNAALPESNANLKIRVVHHQKIDFQGDSQTNVTALQSLASSSEVARLRQRHGADLVSLLTKTGPYCGMAYVPEGYAGQLLGKHASYSVVGSLCVSSFAHELGHNLGLVHSAAQGEEGSLFKWARGHGVQGSFVTTMAYPGTYNTRVTAQRYSNPDVYTCYGRRCGVPIDEPNGADAARAMNHVAAEVAGYFASVKPVDPNPDKEQDSQPPSEPVNLRLVEASEDSIELQWVAATDNVGVAYYDVVRNGAKVGTSTEPHYIDAGLAASQSYQYHVIAVDAAGNTSAESNLLTAQMLDPVQTGDQVAPTPPAHLHVTETTRTAISLSWEAATDDVAVTGYTVFRNSVPIATVAETTYTDADTNLTQDLDYHYMVTAQDAAGNVSAASNGVLARLHIQDEVDDEADTAGNSESGAGSDAENVLRNGHFDDWADWLPYYAHLSQSAEAASGENGLLAESSWDGISGAYQMLDLERLTAGEYVFEVQAKLGADEIFGQAAAVLYVRDGRNWQMYPLGSSVINSENWSEINGAVTLPEDIQPELALLFIYTQDVQRLHLDEALFKIATHEGAAPEEGTNLENEVDTEDEIENLVVNPGFEQGTDGWRTMFRGRLKVSLDAVEGEQSGKMTARRRAHSGIGQDMTGIVTPGATYEVSAWVKYEGSAYPERLVLRVFQRESAQDRGQWQVIEKTTAEMAGEWVRLAGTVTLSEADLDKVIVFVHGPRRRVDLYLDKVIVTPVE